MSTMCYCGRIKYLIILKLPYISSNVLDWGSANYDSWPVSAGKYSFTATQ